MDVDDPRWQQTLGVATQMTAAMAARSRQRASALPTVVAGIEQTIEVLYGPTVPDGFEATIERLAPDIDYETIVQMPDASLDGYISWVRGYFGEQRIIELLNAEALPTPPGAGSPELAEDLRQEGWDLSFDRGETVAQVKISGGSGPILDHFAAHPDVFVVYTTSDAADAVRLAAGEGAPITVVSRGEDWPDVDGFIVVDSGFSSDELTQEVSDTFASATEWSGGLLGDVLDDIPWIALGLIAVRGFRRWVVTDDELQSVFKDAGAASKNLAINAGAGEIISSALGADILKGPITLATGLGRYVWTNSKTSIDRSTAHARQVSQLLRSG